MAKRKTVYVAGPVTGVESYWVPFADACVEIEGRGHNTLDPTMLPQGFTNAQYMRVCFSMIDMADVVYFLPGWENSEGAKLERHYCDYVKKPYIFDICELKEVKV